MTEMSDAFGEHYKQADAWKELQSLTQTGDHTSINDYLNRMQRLNWIVKYGDDALKDQINRGLRSEIKRAIAAQAVSKDEPFGKWLERVRRTGLEMEAVDNDLKERSLIEKGYRKERFEMKGKEKWKGEKRIETKPRFKPGRKEWSGPRKTPDVKGRRDWKDDLGATPEEKER